MRPITCFQCADACDALADEARDDDLAEEWRLMAAEWRAAAFVPANDNRAEASVGRFDR
jgi:hypothetical protein